MQTTFLFLMIFLPYNTFSQDTIEDISGICRSAQANCQKCISAHPGCTWCGESISPNSSIQERCKTERANNMSCRLESIQNPHNRVSIDKNDQFTSPNNVDTSDDNLVVVQLKPQAISVKLRNGETQRVNFTFRRVIDYPLDLYYVMDLSYSMKDDLKTLQELGSNLVVDIRNISENVRLGFGSFVDKVLMPYASTISDHLINPCFEIKGATCAPVFGFRHQLPITSNGEAFKDVVRSTSISGNVDSPEGGFDALMQIAVCQNEIKWRRAALRVILFTTDASPHLAMDGKLAAILEKNDMKCHLESGIHPYLPLATVYSKSKVLDYPSIGQLKNAFKLNKIQTIFAVTNEVREFYEDLPKLLDNSFVDTLNNDSSNILTVIQTSYNALKGKIQLIKPTMPANVELRYRVSCRGGPWVENSLDCDNVFVGNEVTFQFELKATSCPTSPDQQNEVKINSNTITDGVTINIGYICECDCTKDREGNSSRCNHKGSLECGICKCDAGVLGSQCQCTQTAMEVSTEDCKAPDRSICSNNGKCECGICECKDQYFEKFCECTKTGCPKANGEICGGMDKGECKNCNNNKKCVCNEPDWSHDDLGTCTCSDNKCRPSENRTFPVCSGQGLCACDSCKCNLDSLYYTGRYCERCVHPKCKQFNGTCETIEIRDCAVCVYNQQNTGESALECREACQNNGLIDVRYISSLPDCNNCENTPQSENCKICASFNREFFTPVKCESSLTASGCTAKYMISWLEERQDYTLYVRNFNKESDCPKPIDPLLIALPVVGGIVLIGLIALIVWKVLQTLRDRTEYHKFLLDLKNAESSQGINPLYSNASVRVENPVFVE